MQTFEKLLLTSLYSDAFVSQKKTNRIYILLYEFGLWIVRAAGLLSNTNEENCEDFYVAYEKYFCILYLIYVIEPN